MHMCIVSIIQVVVIVFAITGIGFAIGKANKFGETDDIGRRIKMTLTQIWMLIIILLMAVFMVVSTIWGKTAIKIRTNKRMFREHYGCQKRK